MEISIIIYGYPYFPSINKKNQFDNYSYELCMSPAVSVYFRQDDYISTLPRDRKWCKIPLVLKSRPYNMVHFRSFSILEFPRQKLKMCNRSWIGGSPHHAHCGAAFRQALQLVIAGSEQVESAFPSLRSIHNNIVWIIIITAL